MKKSLFAVIAMLVWMTPPVAALDEGFEYVKVSTAQPTVSTKKIEVLELFWYGCPHCNDFEPYLNEWLKNKPDNVEFVRLPAIFRDSWVPHARAYYTAEALGVLDKTHIAFFHAVHKQKRRLLSEKDIGDFYVEQGVKREDFTKAWNSFLVQSRVKRAIGMTKRYGITGVPAMVVNGKYRTSAKEASIHDSDGPKYENVIKVVDWLVQRETTLAGATKPAAKNTAAKNK